IPEPSRAVRHERNGQRIVIVADVEDDLAAAALEPVLAIVGRHEPLESQTIGTPLGPRISTIAFRSSARNAATSALTASSRDSKLFCPAAAKTSPCRPITSASAMLRAFIAVL